MPCFCRSYVIFPLYHCFVERTISAASEDYQSIVDQISKEAEKRNIERFSQAQNDVELIIGTERDELDAWLVSCKGDYSNIGERVISVQCENK